MAQTDDIGNMTTAKIEELARRQKALADLLAAETALRNARTAAEGPTDAQQATTEAQAQKALAEAQKATADARKAGVESQVAAATAFANALPTTDVKGDVTIKTDAGKGDVFLLSAAATNDAGAMIAERALEHMKDLGGEKTLILSTSASGFDLTAWPLFDLQTNNLASALSSAIGEKDRVEQQVYQAVEAASAIGHRAIPGRREAVAATAAIGGAVNAATKLLSLLKTDYTVKGFLEDGDDGMLLAAVAAGLSSEGIRIVIPERTPPAASVTAVFDKLKALDRQRLTALQIITLMRGLVVQVDGTLALETVKENKPIAAQLKKAKASASDLADALETIVAAYDALATRLLTVEEGKAGLNEVVASHSAADLLEGDGVYLMTLKSEKFAGAYYTKKNLWTALGGMPFFVAGGSVASYAVVETKTGVKISAGLIPVHSGYYKAKKVRKRLSGQ